MAIIKPKKTTAPIVENAFAKKNSKPINLVIDATLHEQFKIKTVTEGTSMTDVIVFYIREYLKT